MSARCSRASPPDKHHEARTRDPASRFEIEPAEGCAQRHVIARLEGEAPGLAPASYFDIGRLVAAFRHARVQQIGQSEQDLLELCLHVTEPQLNGLQLATQRIGARQERGNVLSCSLRLADRLGLRVALAAQAVRLDLQLLALLLQGGERREVEREPAPREVCSDDFRFVAEQPGIDHGTFFSVSLVEALRWRRRSSASAMRISSPRGTG